MTYLFKILKNRFVVFALFLIAFVILQYCFYGTYFPSTENKDLWFYSGIIMVLFSILFIDPYYTSPKNVVANAIPLLLVFFAIKTSFENTTIWWVAVAFLILLLVTSIAALSLDDKNKSPTHWKNKLSSKLKDLAVFFGQGKVLYSMFFIYFLLTYYSIQNFYTLILFVLWFFILSINPKSIHNNFLPLTTKSDDNLIGEIFSVQSKKIFLAKLFEDKTNIGKFDVVKFKYSMQDSNKLTITGIVFDTYLLNQEKWAKILQLTAPQNDETILERNAVYKISTENEISKANLELRVDDLVGVVIDDSTVGKIKFEYSKKNDDLQEGDLLELKISDKRLFYQVIGGSTDKERLDNEKNETGFIKGEAFQLGEWQSDKLSFRKFGWVPQINTALFKADTSDIVVESFQYPLYQLGTIPGTTLPSVINLNEAISHHMALLGVTGAGKSFLAFEIIKQLKTDTKVICIDLTGEWKEKLSKLNPELLIDVTGLSAVENAIARKEAATKSKNPDQVLKFKGEIQDKINSYVKKYAESKNNIAVFELPDLSNTSFILEFTQMFLESVFVYAKQNKGKKFCIVLEEAHTVVPETTFLGDLGDYSSNKGLVSKIGQIALQGRKFNVGFLVIAQRTANVSKTILTQCNTVVCFQAFDETSFNFLGNYIGKDMVVAIPNLKTYHAVVAGKSLKSNIPMIVDLTRK